MAPVEPGSLSTLGTCKVSSWFHLYISFRLLRSVEQGTRYGTTFLKPGTTISIGSTLQRHMDQKKVIISATCPFHRHFHLILQVLKRVGLGLPAGFLAGSNIATQRASISVYHRFEMIQSDGRLIGNLEQVPKIPGTAR